MPFEKGNRANPGGRPKKTQQQIDFEQRCRDWAALFAFDRLRKWADKDNPEAARWAITELLNRGFGKPVETAIVDATITNESGADLDLINRAAEIRKRLASVGTGPDQLGVSPAGTA